MKVDDSVVMDVLITDNEFLFLKKSLFLKKIRDAVRYPSCSVSDNP